MVKSCQIFGKLNGTFREYHHLFSQNSMIFLKNLIPEYVIVGCLSFLISKLGKGNGSKRAKRLFKSWKNKRKLN